MFGPPPLITFIRQFIKLPDNILNVLHTDISNVKPCLLYFFGIVLDLIHIEVINHFTGIPTLLFGSEYVIIILSRLQKFNNMSKVTYLSLLLISLCLLTLRRPQFFMFTAESSPSVNFSSPVKFSSWNVF